MKQTGKTKQIGIMLMVFCLTIISAACGQYTTGAVEIQEAEVESAMHDSFPHALELSKMGYNSFALIYRPEEPYADLAQAIRFIYDHAEELEVNPEDYSLWGGSAGARMAATLGNRDVLSYFDMAEISQAAAVIMQYTGYSTVSDQDAPAYACVGTSDGIASWRTMQSRLQALEKLGIPTEFHSYEGLPHGFGLGTGTKAEGGYRMRWHFGKNSADEMKLIVAT